MVEQMQRARLTKLDRLVRKYHRIEHTLIGRQRDLARDRLKASSQAVKRRVRAAGCLLYGLHG